ncbi:DUF1189 family protein [Candidatus Woesearchaeota archaeon]|nr:DUF1189 family protein [Candidatus Woesearchaeota archaeon]
MKGKRATNMWQLLKDFLKTWHPSSYWHLAHKPILDAYKYFLFIILVGFIGMIIVGLPKFILIPDYLQAKMQNFDELNIDLDVKMNKPVALTTRDPEIIIDTTGQLNNVSKIMKHAHLFITNDTLYYKIFLKPEKLELSRYKDVLKEKKQYATALYYLVLFSLPSILFVTLIVILIRYLVITHVIAVLGFVLTRLAGYAIDFKTIFNSALYASTVMILPELILFPLLKPLFNVPIALFIILYIIVIIIECQKLRHRVHWGNM